MVGRAYKGIGLLILLLITCAVIGSFLGDLLQPYIPGLFTKTFRLGVGPFPIDLKVLNVTFGLTIYMNLMSIIGLVSGFVIYKKGF